MKQKVELESTKEYFIESSEEYNSRVIRIKAEIDSWPDWKKSAITYEAKSVIKI